MPTKAAPAETLRAPTLDAPSKPPRMLTDVFREQLRLRRYALRTEETYMWAGRGILSGFIGGGIRGRWEAAKCGRI